MSYEEEKQFILEYVKRSNVFPASFDISTLPKPLVVEIILTNSKYLETFGVDKFQPHELIRFATNDPRTVLPMIPDNMINRNFLLGLINKDPNVIAYLTTENFIKLNPWDINTIDYSKLLDRGYIGVIDYVFSRNYIASTMKEYVVENSEFFKHMSSKIKNYYLKATIGKRSEYRVMFKNIEDNAIDEELVEMAAEKLNEAEFINLFGKKIFKGKYAKTIKDTNATLYLNNVSEQEATEEMYKEVFEKDYYNILDMPLSQTNKKMWITALNYSLSHRRIKLRQILSRMPARYFDKRTLNMFLYRYPSYVRYISPKAFNADMVMNYLITMKNNVLSEGKKLITFENYVYDVENLIIKHMNKEIFDFCYENNVLTYDIVGEANIGNFIIDHPVVFEKLAKINPSIIKKAKKVELNDPDKYKHYIVHYDEEIIKFVPEKMLSSEFIYECAVEKPKVLKYVMETPKLRKYATSELVKLYVSKSYYYATRLDYIPDDFLTPDLAAEIFKKNNNALMMVPKDKRTRKMYEVAADLGITSKDMPTDLVDMMRYNRELETKKSKLEQKRIDYVVFGEYIPMYFSDDSIGVKTFCERNNISEHKFKKILTDLEEFYPEIYDEYRNLVEIHHKEAWGHVLDALDQVKTALNEGMENPETKKKSELNVILYYLITVLDPKAISDILIKRLPREKYQLFYRQIVAWSKDSSKDVKSFYNTVIKIKTDSGYREINKAEKDMIINFLDKNSIPKNSRTISVLTKMYLNREIDLKKVYPKIIKYDLEEEKRKAISERLSIINIQDEVIKKLDEKIEELKNSKRRAIL